MWIKKLTHASTSISNGITITCYHHVYVCFVRFFLCFWTEQLAINLLLRSFALFSFLLLVIVILDSIPFHTYEWNVYKRSMHTVLSDSGALLPLFPLTFVAGNLNLNFEYDGTIFIYYCTSLPFHLHINIQTATSYTHKIKNKKNRQTHKYTWISHIQHWFAVYSECTYFVRFHVDICHWDARDSSIIFFSRRLWSNSTYNIVFSNANQF